MALTRNVALSALVRGKVQGVGFRYSCLRVAAELKLTGWVRNAEDGSVQVWAEGPQPLLDKLLSWLQKGPSWASVTQVSSSRDNATGAYNSFDILA